MISYVDQESNEVVRIMTETELKEYRKNIIKVHDEFKRRKLRRRIMWILTWILKLTAASIVSLGIFLMFWCNIPPM